MAVDQYRIDGGGGARAGRRRHRGWSGGGSSGTDVGCGGGELCALAGGGKEDEVRRGEKVTPSPLFIVGWGSGSGLIAPMIFALRGGNVRTTCPTS